MLRLATQAIITLLASALIGGGVAFAVSTDAVGTDSYSASKTVYGQETCPPYACSGSATSVGQTSATVKAVANANGATTTVQFDYGKNGNCDSTHTANQSIGKADSYQNITKTFTGLARRTKYCYRIQATNAGGTTSGSWEYFTTS